MVGGGWWWVGTYGDGDTEAADDFEEQPQPAVGAKHFSYRTKPWPTNDKSMAYRRDLRTKARPIVDIFGHKHGQVTTTEQCRVLEAFLGVIVPITIPTTIKQQLYRRL